LSKILYNTNMTLGLQRIIVLRFWGWYYTGAVKNLVRAWKNFIIFVREYYSIPLLLRTLIVPWRRDVTRRPRGLDIKKLFEALAFNLISRGIGFIIRSITVVIGLICLIGVIILGFVTLVIWLILPMVLLFFIVVGVLLLAG
jgi:hypothetical protein